MNQDTVISKINGFMFQMTGQLSTWLGKRLPQFTDKWWFELVINNLTTFQRQHVIDNNISDIDGLDLAALLCVFDRNWIMLSNRYYMNNKYRSSVKKMREIRNNWAHITPNDINKKRVIEDVGVMIEVMELIDSPSKIISSLEAFQFDVEESSDFSEQSAIPILFDPPGETREDESIKAGSMVVLKSNPNVTGVVMSVDGEQYTVFVDGEPQTFFREQIQLKQKKKDKAVSLQRVRTALTAYQLNNPANSNLYSLNTARIDFVPYQFRPALKMVKSDAQRILVADDVGVGKTIEAGLILKELEARNNIKSVLVICPRALVVEHKWQIEMENFDEKFTSFDGKDLSEALIQTQKTGIWPEQHNKIIIPYSLFSEDSVMGTLSKSNKKKKTVGLAELDIAPHFDLVIVDEAHHIRNDQTWMYRGVEQFCQNAGAVVFLTATPLQNSNKDLYTLLNLLRPDIVVDEDIFETMAEPNRYINKMLGVVKAQGEDWREKAKEEIDNILNTTWGRNVIQHMPSFERVYEYLDKQEINREEKLELITLIESLHSFANIITRTRRNEIGDFCERRENTSGVEFTQVQEDLYETLIEFESAVLSRIHGRRSVRFMMMTLMRQAASCIYGLAPLMNDITAKRLEQLQEEGELLEEDYELNEEDVNLIYELADTISDLSEQLPDDDPKFERAYQIIKESEQAGSRKVIVFSSFRCTLGYLKRRLLEKGIRVGQVDGSVPDDMRRSLRDRFKMDPENPDALDVLLFSEVGCEGLDYQFCDTMINYDLPWNPMRIEQRIGRIDRRGQKSPAVKIYNIITKGTIDEMVYQYCLRKIDIFNESIGDCATILGDISKLIMEIMLDPNLSEEERNMHMEQMADNEIREIQEMRRLEKEEKSLFGFDLSQYMIDQDVQNAECTWVSPEQIGKLTDTFLKDFLGDSDYIIGKGEVKNLRLRADYRQKLYRDYLENKPLNQNQASTYWAAYLQSDKPNLAVTYDAETARNDMNLTFLTPMHPLVVRAAEYESKDFFPCDICVEVDEETLPKGEYEFAVYAWRYYGLRPDIKLIAISENEMVESNVINYLQFASQGDADFGRHEDKWRDLDRKHYERWQKAKADFVSLVQDDSAFRADQITQSYQQSVDKIQKILQKLTEEKIINMRRRQIEKLRFQYEEQIADLNKTRQGAEIRATRLIKGVLKSV